MNARATPTGDGSADASHPNAAALDSCERQRQTLEATIRKHEAAHKARIEQLNAQSEAYVRAVRQEIEYLTTTEERLLSYETENGAAPRNEA